MRVGLFTYGMKDQLTGIGRYAMQLSYAIRQVAPDIEITLMNPYPDSWLSWYKDFPVIPVPSLKRLPAVVTLGPLLLAHVARRYRLDLLHDPCGIAPFFPWQKAKRIVTIHDAIPLIYPRLYPWMGRLVFHTGVPWSRWTTHGVVTVSYSAKDDLAKHARIPRDHMSVIYPGVDVLDPDSIYSLQNTSPPLAMDKDLMAPYFLYVGAINPRKNVARIIEAVKVLRQRGENIRLLIVGPNKPPEEDGDMVHYIGYVDQDTLNYLYVHATAVLVPSLYEGFGFPALEAMARQAVAIVANVSSLPEVTGEGAIHVDPHDTRAWVQAMHRVLTDSDYRCMMAQAGYEVAHRFSWEKAAQKTALLYRQVVNG